MRELADESRIERFMRELGRAARKPASVYFTGGATAVLLGWRQSTIDVALLIVPEDEGLLRAVPDLKESLKLNVELAAPSDFIPVPDGWEDRAWFVRQEGLLAFYHYDLTAQALAKVERGHAQDLDDVREMLRRGLVGADALRAMHRQIVPQLYRYPAVDARRFRQAVEDVAASVRP